MYALWVPEMNSPEINHCDAYIVSQLADFESKPQDNQWT